MEKTIEINKFVKMISECLDNNNFQQAEKLREELFYADMKATNDIYMTGRMIQRKKEHGNMIVSNDFTMNEINTYIQLILASKPVLNYKKELNSSIKSNEIQPDSTQFSWYWFQFFNNLSSEEMCSFIKCFHEDDSTELRLLNEVEKPNDKLFFINEGSIITMKKDRTDFNLLKIYEKGTIAGFEPFFLSPSCEDVKSAKVIHYDNKVHYIAHENTHIHYVVKSEMDELLKKYPDINKKLSDFCLMYEPDLPPIMNKSG